MMTSKAALEETSEQIRSRGRSPGPLKFDSKGSFGKALKQRCKRVNF